MGDGSKISFLHDLWCGNHPLKVAFFEVFSIARCKEAWVADHMQFLNKILQNNIFFTRPVIGRWTWSLLSLIFCTLSN